MRPLERRVAPFFFFDGVRRRKTQKKKRHCLVFLLCFLVFWGCLNGFCSLCLVFSYSLYCCFGLACLEIYGNEALVFLRCSKRRKLTWTRGRLVSISSVWSSASHKKVGQPPEEKKQNMMRNVFRMSELGIHF